ncbi:DUF1538 domain-containing protein [Enterococcus hirae]|uniref:DUF1538 domain-containing protein n=1 Tax=uncultured Enterococcus sp. TaxID=167972 RepID=UPI00259852E0|nr:DUF1538 domain-containing protein [uncultured Enterococcus sp.]EMF0615990.1 DUF1538 domain-containing protein [Enterococcus hirae]
MLKNLKEVVIAILPMTLLIVILTFIFAPLDSDEMISFLFGAGIMMIGMTLFLFGADYSMMEVGRLVGKYMIKKKSLTILIALGFMIGIVSVGTGVFLAFALLRVVFKLSYYQLMAIGYVGVLVASFFTSNEFMPIAFDSGGVTTGPITVPFILALAGGLTSMIRQETSANDSFGMVGIASLGPILAVMILGVIFQ